MTYAFIPEQRTEGSAYADLAEDEIMGEFTDCPTDCDCGDC